MRADVGYHILRLTWKVSKVFDLVGGRGAELSLKSVMYLILFLLESHKNTFNLIRSLTPLYV